MSRDIIDVYDRSIFEMRNVFTAEECQAFIDYHKNSPDKKAGTVVSSQGIDIVDKKYKISTDIAIDDSTHYLFTRFVEGVKKARLEYTTHVSNTNRCCGLSYLNVGYITNPQIQRTDKGGKFEWHSDFSFFSDRQLAIIVYLNDIDEENGGSTEFNSGRKVQPEVGKVIVFPVTPLHLHKGNAILNGPSKYIITAFTLKSKGVPFTYKYI